MIGAIVALFGCQLAGEVIARALFLPIPGPVIGLVLMLGFLFLRKDVPEELETVATTLLKHLSLLFVPAGVGILLHLERVSAEWLPLGAALIVSAVLTVAITALVFRAVSRLTGAADETPDESGGPGDRREDAS
ncbi:MAG: CidA/LrgA family protein [Alphaproteobacteria bacterium]|nr:CidA/LrgA family protein [Alphaproteobacteria bacterium]